MWVGDVGLVLQLMICLKWLFHFQCWCFLFWFWFFFFLQSHHPFHVFFQMCMKLSINNNLYIYRITRFLQNCSMNSPMKNNCPPQTSCNHFAKCDPNNKNVHFPSFLPFISSNASIAKKKNPFEHFHRQTLLFFSLSLSIA